MKTWNLLTAALVLMPAVALAAPSVGWVQARTWAKKKSQPAAHWPGMALDNKKETRWCVAGGASGAVGKGFNLGFKGEGKITALKVVNGDGRGPAQFKKSNRVSKLIIDEGTYRREVGLTDDGKAQTITLEPAIEASRLRIEIGGVFGEEELTCLSDMIFQSGKKATSGSWMAADLRFNRRQGPLHGVWAAGPEGAAEKFLSLYLDGTFRWVYAPNDPDLKGRKLSGKWSLKGNRLLLQIGGQWHGIKLERGQAENELGEPLRQLTVSGAKGRVEGMEGDYRDRWM